MSIFYKENNKETTIELYNKSIVYKDKMIRPADNNIVNFNLGEKFLYGRVRQDSTPIVIGNTSMLKKHYFETSSRNCCCGGFRGGCLRRDGFTVSKVCCP